jgi:predicted Zn-dependent protease
VSSAVDKMAAGLRPAQQIVEDALVPGGDDGRVVIVEEASHADVRFANNTVTSNGVRRTRTVTVVSFRNVQGGMAVGEASLGGDVDVADLVARAQRDAAESKPADDAAPLIDGGSDADFGAPAPVTGISVLQGVLGGLSGAFGRAGDHHVLYGFAEHGIDTTYLGSSTGLRRRHAQPTGALHFVARSPDGARSAWSGTGTPDFSDVVIEPLEERLVQRLSWAERQISLEAGRYEVVIPPEAVADLMTDLLYAASGRDAEDGRTVFSRPGGGTRVGEALSSTPFELRSDPAEPGIECAPFLATGSSGSDVSVFDNGMSLGPTTWIAGGRLARLRYHRAGAARSGVEPAAWVDNLVLELPGATASLDDLVASTERGLLLTCLWYIREVDPVTLLLTGLTRDGVYLVEEGKVVGAVNNFRFNESPVDLLARATEASASVRALGREWGEWLNRASMPALRVPDFNMSSVSPAS